MGIVRTAVFTALMAGAVTAQDLNLACTGDNWSLTVTPETAELIYPTLTEMEVVLDTPAAGHDWPRALTLIGTRDTAILIVDQRQCTAGDTQSDYTGELLTQRGQTPVLLIGCCERLP